MSETETLDREQLDADAIYQSHPFLRHLAERGNIRKFSGGRSIIQELQWPAWHMPYEAGGGPVGSIFTAADFPIHQVGGTPNKIEQGFGRAISGALFGLRHLLNPTPATYVGGIDRERWPFWQPLILRRSPGVPLKDAMDIMFERLSYGKTSPDIILANLHDFKLCEEFLKTGKGKSLCFNDALVVCDEFAEPTIEGNTIAPASMLVLNSKYIYLRYHQDRSFHRLRTDILVGSGEGPEETFIHYSGYQLLNIAKSAEFYGWAGSVTMSCAYAQGALLT